MTLNGIVARLWHNSTLGLIFAVIFEICMFDLLFDYEVWRRLRQVLCLFEAKNGFCNANFVKFWGLK